MDEKDQDFIEEYILVEMVDNGSTREKILAELSDFGYSVRDIEGLYWLILWNDGDEREEIYARIRRQQERAARLARGEKNFQRLLDAARDQATNSSGAAQSRRRRAEMKCTNCGTDIQINLAIIDVRCPACGYLNGDRGAVGPTGEDAVGMAR